MHLSPQILVGAYEFLRVTPPFSRWRLPEADDITFHIKPLKDKYADFDYTYAGGKPRRNWTIVVDPRLCAYNDTLLRVLAHEMVHLRRALLGHRLDVEHGAAFQKLARQVCHQHGFDPNTF